MVSSYHSSQGTSSYKNGKNVHHNWEVNQGRQPNLHRTKYLSHCPLLLLSLGKDKMDLTRWSNHLSYDAIKETCLAFFVSPSFDSAPKSVDFIFHELFNLGIIYSRLLMERLISEDAVLWMVFSYQSDIKNLRSMRLYNSKKAMK